MNDRHGFALIAVLWVVAALAMLVSAGLAHADVGRAASENRSALRRSFWAAQACLSIGQAEYARRPEAEIRVDSTDLGRTVWCELGSLDPATRLHVPGADSTALTRILGEPVMSASLLDWIDADSEPRPLGAEAEYYRALDRPEPRNGPPEHLRELLLVRGFESVTEEALAGLLTFRGDGRVNPNLAPAPVVRAAGIVPQAKVAQLIARRSQTPFRDAEHLATALGLDLTATGFRDLTRRTVFDKRRRVLDVRGHVSSGPRTLSTRLVVTAIALPERLAVLRIEVE